MTKKILYIASRDTHLLSFHQQYIKWFKDKGYQVHLAYNGHREIPYADKIFKFPFERSPLRFYNINIYKKLKNLFNHNNYILIHCHTPTVGVLTRLAAISARKNGTKVLYTSHGFMFYKGAPMINWFIYFPIQWILSLFTDGLITVNKEDYRNIIQKKFPVKGKYKINSIGIDNIRVDINKYPPKEKIKAELGYLKDDIIILYIAEFNPGKRHEFVISAFSKLVKKYPNIKLQFAGSGLLMKNIEEKVKKINLENQISFLKFTKDIAKYIKITDIGISASDREGFGLGVAEINMNGIPIVISNIRGHNEIVVDGVNGFLFEVNNKEQFIEKTSILIEDNNLRKKMGQNGINMMEKFKIENTLNEMNNIYNKYLQ